MSIRVTLALHLKPELADMVKNGIAEGLGETRSFAGCEEISLLQSQDDPNMLLVLEQWDSRASYEAYFAWRTERGELDTFDSITTQPYEVRFYDYVRA